MKCWIASFPRSGNTFFRNILFYVYGLESSTWHQETDYPVDEKYADFPFVKTHLLPDQLIPSDPIIPAIYLVRDGRDAMVSIAHHRSDIVSPGSDFLVNLQEAIIAAEGSFFGGWSENVKSWGDRANLIIKYEDLIKDPKQQFERVEKLLPMPTANWDNLPDFKSMKFGTPKYGGQTTSKSIKVSPEEFSQRFFRKGQAGSWKEDMPHDLLGLFWSRHGDVMNAMGYHGHPMPVSQNVLLDAVLMKKLNLPISEKPRKEPYRVLIEANKLQLSKNDGIKRYLIQLLKGLQEVSKFGNGEFEFKLLINKKIEALENYHFFITSEVVDVKSYEKVLLKIKKVIKAVLPRAIYEPLAEIYRHSPSRSLLRQARSTVTKREEEQFVSKLGDKENPFDIIHIPLPQNYIYVEKLKGNLIATIHDLTHRINPEYHIGDNVMRTELGIQHCKDNASHFIAISEHTKGDFIKEYHVDDSKVSRIYESADNELFFRNYNPTLGQEVRQRYLIPRDPFFLCLSTLEPRKNLVNTIRAFALFKERNKGSNVKLIISGDRGWKTNAILKESESLGGEVYFTGFIEDRDLHVLYSEALAFLYMSFYEGFGLPPLEAMACRTPVLHSNRSSLEEVVGDCGVVADPESPEDIAEKMERIFFDFSYRELMAERGFKQALKFSSRRTLLETLTAYKKCLK